MKQKLPNCMNAMSNEALGLCLLILHQANSADDIPEDVEELRRYYKHARGFWPEIAPYITDMKLIANAERSVRTKRKEAADKRWGKTPRVDKEKVKKIKLTPLKGPSVDCFARIWEAWPKRSDGKPSRGEKAKAMKLFQEIVDSRVANPFELEEAVVVYRHYPNVLGGFVKMVATFFAIKDGMWMECLERVRRGPKASQLKEMG